MSGNTFVQKHPQQQFKEEENNFDYTERNYSFIRSLRSMEQLMDLDAYILDYQNECFLYLTQHCFLWKFFPKKNSLAMPVDFSFYDKIIHKDDISKVGAINREAYNFYYNLPIERRYSGSYTLDMRVQDGKGNYVLVNNKTSLLDMTDDGRIRLALCILSYPTSKIPGRGYFKMTDTSTVYEFFENTGKFIEVKTQQITSKTEAILDLASEGKTEAEISRHLNISINTVKYHKRRIFRQLNVRNIAEAIQWKNSQKTILKE